MENRWNPSRVCLQALVAMLAVGPALAGEVETRRVNNEMVVLEGGARCAGAARGSAQPLLRDP